MLFSLVDPAHILNVLLYLLSSMSKKKDDDDDDDVCFFNLGMCGNRIWVRFRFLKT